MNTSSRMLTAIKEAGRYVDFSKGEVKVKVLTSSDSLSTVIEVTGEPTGSAESSHFLATVNTDGSLKPHGEVHSMSPKTSSAAIVDALSFVLREHPQYPIANFSAVVNNFPHHVEVSLKRLPEKPGGLLVLKVAGDKVSVITRGR